jgi:hypothetical protein
MLLASIMPESAGEGLFEYTIKSFPMVFGLWKLVGYRHGVLALSRGTQYDRDDRDSAVDRCPRQYLRGT